MAILVFAVIQQIFSVTASYNAGATHSCLDYHVYHHLPLEHKPPLHPRMLQFHKPATDLPYPNARACDLKIHITNCTIYQLVHVI
jgi:hypothetical protein